MQYIHIYKKTFLLKLWFRNYINYFIIDFLNWLFIDPIDNSKYKIGIEDGPYWVAILLCQIYSFLNKNKTKNFQNNSFLYFEYNLKIANTEFETSFDLRQIVFHFEKKQKNLCKCLSWFLGLFNKNQVRKKKQFFRSMFFIIFKKASSKKLESYSISSKKKKRFKHLLVKICELVGDDHAHFIFFDATCSFSGCVLKPESIFSLYKHFF